MPITAYSDYRVSYTPTHVPTSRSATLEEALRLVVQDASMAPVVFKQFPAALQEIIDGACREAFAVKFRDLSSEQQKDVFAGLLLAVASAKSVTVQPAAENSAPPRGKGVAAQRPVSQVPLPSRDEGRRDGAERSLGNTRPTSKESTPPKKKWWQFWR